MKVRLDKLLLARNLAPSRHKAQAIIGAGKVFVNGQLADKAGSSYASDCSIEIKGSDSPFVSRGGLKLAAALESFQVSPKGLICADFGASTGGFTDCLLQGGATHVFAIDVGYGQLAWKLRTDDRVTVMERTNARYLTPDDISQPIELGVVDASFISLKLLLPPLLQLFRTRTSIKIIALIKPQFEVGKGKVGKGGVVRDEHLHQQVIEDIKNFSLELGLTDIDVIESPIKGPKGNKEFLIYLDA
jgi:23S rRNA (cytidine1920-2'-O)/16S rRNA (cytidine1409-2'-O)-methyltransferase